MEGHKEKWPRQSLEGCLWLGGKPDKVRAEPGTCSFIETTGRRCLETGRTKKSGNQRSEFGFGQKEDVLTFENFRIAVEVDTRRQRL